MEIPVLTGYEWHAVKNAANIAKHGIAFDDAIQIFDGPYFRYRSQRNDEERYVAIGQMEGIVIAVIYTVRDNIRRIISARRARANEERDYRQAFRVNPS